MGQLDGKVVFVTGAARGQGRAHAVVSAREGAKVILTDIGDDINTVPYPLATPSELNETARLVEEASGVQPVVAIADVRSQRALDKAVQSGIEAFGQIDCLIANAGIWSLSPIWELSDDEWSDSLSVNLTGVFRSVKAVLPHMIERRSGSIVLTASVNGVEPTDRCAHYVAGKHGVIGLMKSIAREVGQFNIRCNAINPGVIDTPMINWQGAYDLVAGHADGVRDDMIRAGYNYHVLPQGPMNPEACANVAVWLNSHYAAAVTGVAVPVDGGHLLLGGSNPQNVPL
ncbi:oxidoreductase [Mycolicibacterium mucogenicum]|uniref:Oxidoreductase n=1 Tax=Mycolicibacterium mucogenicum TaxID=56689 RepID=A0A1A3H9V4_MYCMU|nr:mycofactocin-coupled SDR family oxidoreductase [Mycolicibacterium mucogenicum]OBJ44815.1 oxidoreductase [Mycolicibacterium mucogenicum]